MALRRRRKLTVEVSPTGGDNDGDRAADVEERAEPARVVVLDPAGEFGNAVDNDVSLDMYLVRPADIIRRAFDEFAFALRYFFLGAIVETQRDEKFIYFQTTEELVKQGGEVWGVPVLVKDRNLQRRIPAERFDPEDPDAVDNLCAVFNKCVHSTEAGYLILNVCKVDHWFIHREGTTTKLFGDNAGQLAREMFLLRNYFFHRTYLTAGENDLWAFAETLFSTMIALAEGFAPKLIPKKFRTAFQVHLGNVRKIRRVFFHLRDNYREPDSAGDCIAKLETIIGEVGSLGKDVEGWEHYLCGVLAPRFVIQGDFRDPFSAVEISEELPADPMDGFEVVGVPGSDITSMTHVARVDITDDGRLATRSFGVADPFSVTHADLINRALDWIGVFLRQLLSVGQEDCLNDNESAASDLYYLFANAPNQQRLARRHIPALYITTYVNPDSKSNRYWKMSVEERKAMNKARAARTRLESFCIDQDLDLDGIADDDTDDLERDFLSSTPYAVDPSSVLKFFERCFDKFGRLYNGADARFHRNVLNAIAEVDFPFQQTLRDIIKLRDSLSHHINIHSAGALRVRDLAHMVEATADLTRHLVEVFAPMNEGCMQYVNAFDELLSVFDLTVVRGEYSLYQTFRHRQGAYARAVHNESSDIEARGRLVTWGTRLARLFRDKAAGEGEVIPDADWEQILLVLRATTPSLQTDLGNDAEPPRSPNAVSIDLRWGGFGALEVDADVLQSVSTPPPLPDLKFPPRDDVCELVADEYEGDQLLRMLGDEPDDLMIVHYIKEKRHEGHLVKKEIRARLKTRNVSHTRFAHLWIRAREEQGGSE